MNKMFCVVVVFVSFFFGICGQQEAKQERAKVLYVNAKYMKNVSLLTIREGRRSPYKTSLNFTTLLPFTENVTFRYEFTNTRFHAFPLRIEMKTCDHMKAKWARDWLRLYSNVHFICPLMPGTYSFTRFEMPPRNFPIQFNNIDYVAKTIIFVSATKEKIAEFVMDLKFPKGG